MPSAPSTLKSLEEAALDILNRFPAVEDGVTTAAADLRTTLASIDHLASALDAEGGSFNQLLVQLRSAAVHAQSALDDAKLGATTASLRDTSGSVGRAVLEVSDVRDELRASLVALREALESIRTLADSLERDPSVILRGVRADAPARPKVP